VLGLVAVVVLGALRAMPEVLFAMGSTYFVVGIIHARVTGVVRRASRPS
jgi:hypothetical protein